MKTIDFREINLAFLIQRGFRFQTKKREPSASSKFALEIGWLKRRFAMDPIQIQFLRNISASLRNHRGQLFRTPSPGFYTRPKCS